MFDLIQRTSPPCGFRQKEPAASKHFEPEEAGALLTETVQFEPQHAPTHGALSTAWAALGYQQRSQQEASIAKNLAKDLSLTQQLEYAGLADETRSDWQALGRPTHPF